MDERPGLSDVISAWDDRTLPGCTECYCWFADAEPTCPHCGAENPLPKETQRAAGKATFDWHRSDLVKVAFFATIGGLTLYMLSLR